MAQNSAIEMKKKKNPLKQMEKDIPSKWKSEENWSSYTYIRQNRL